MRIVVSRFVRGKQKLVPMDVCICNQRLLIKDRSRHDSYKIQECAREGDKRPFVLTKDNGDRYACYFSPVGTTCTCEGFKNFGYCRHADALDNLCSTGSVEGIRFLKVA